MRDTEPIDQVLNEAVARGEIPGVVALAADEHGVRFEGALGVRDLARSTPMRLDTVFWIASMTKTITSIAALQLVEHGLVALDAPLAAWLPELAEVQVLDGFAPDGAPRLRSPRRPLTLRHLLTHTAGFGYHIWHPDLRRLQLEHGVPDIGECKRETLRRSPLLFDPGERWEYGINIDWVGQVVERLSGVSLEEYFRRHLFAPLGMADTSFLLRPDQRARVVTVHDRRADGALQPSDVDMEQPEAEFFMGGGGLFSTGPDYVRLLRMLLRGGELDGVRVLRPETVAALGQNQIGELRVGGLRSVVPADSNYVEFFPGSDKKWGLVAMLTPEATPTGRGAGSLAWAGLANTYFWLDLQRRVAGVLLTQILPFGDRPVLALWERFERAVYALLA